MSLNTPGGGRDPDWPERSGREPAHKVLDGGLGGSVQVGQAKDIPLVEKKRRKHTHTLECVCVCVRAQRLLPGSRRQGVFGFAVKREMNKTGE